LFISCLCFSFTAGDPIASNNDMPPSEDNHVSKLTFLDPNTVIHRNTEEEIPVPIPTPPPAPVVIPPISSIDSHNSVVDSHNVFSDSHNTFTDSHNSFSDSHNSVVDSHNTVTDSHNSFSDSHNSFTDTHNSFSDSHNSFSDSHNNNNIPQATHPAFITVEPVAEIDSAADADGSAVNSPTPVHAHHHGSGTYFDGSLFFGYVIGVGLGLLTIAAVYFGRTYYHNYAFKRFIASKTNYNKNPNSNLVRVL